MLCCLFFCWPHSSRFCGRLWSGWCVLLLNGTAGSYWPLRYDGLCRRHSGSLPFSWHHGCGRGGQRRLFGGSGRSEGGGRDGGDHRWGVLLLGRAGEMLGALELVDFLRQGSEAVDEDLQLPLQPAQPALHAGVVLLQLRDLLTLVSGGQHPGQLLELGAQLVLLQAHLVKALLHVEAVALQHAHPPVEAVHG